jgi:hypothetical protein
MTDLHRRPVCRVPSSHGESSVVRQFGSASTEASTVDSPGRAGPPRRIRGFCSLPKPDPVNVVAQSNRRNARTKSRGPARAVPALRVNSVSDSRDGRTDARPRSLGAAGRAAWRQSRELTFRLEKGPLGAYTGVRDGFVQGVRGDLVVLRALPASHASAEATAPGPSHRQQVRLHLRRVRRAGRRQDGQRRHGLLQDGAATGARR